MNNENEAYENLLCGHLDLMVHRLRQMPADTWDWTPDVAAPTARILAAHAWQWLQCDRQHIAEPDALKHASIPEPPREPQAMCEALAAETERWRALIRDLTPEQLAEPRGQFNGHPLNVRWFLFHMIQNCIYKSGQLATLYFALGLDGKAPYTAPFPNPIYAMLHQHAALKAERRGESYAQFERGFAGEAIPPAVLQHTYRLLSSNAGGLPVRPTDSLDEIYHFRSLGIPVDAVVRAIAEQSGRPVTGDLDPLPPVETVSDLVYAVASMTDTETPGNTQSDETR